MKDKQLHDLKNIETPVPSDTAKRRALNSAIEAFEAVQTQEQTKKQKSFQGFSKARSLIYSLNQKLWKQIMKKQIIAGTAFASVCVISFVVLQNNTPRIIPEITHPKVVQQQTGMLGKKEKDIAFSQNNEPQLLQDEAAMPSLDIPSPSTTMRPLFIADSSARMESKAKRHDAAKMQRSLGYAPNQAAQHGFYAPMMSGGVAHSKMRIAPEPHYPQYPQYEGQDKFEAVTPNPVKKTSEHPVSTFSVDVDTASYAFVRKALNSGRLPQKNAIRVEELINYFDYDYALPKNARQPFKPTIAIYPTPWNQHTKLLHIGIKGQAFKKTTF